MIDSFSFGKIKVNGDVYTKDLIIFPDRVYSPWRRESGHCLCVEDLREVFEENPDILVVGTGSLGRMKVAEEVRQKCRDMGIDLVVKKTKAASREFNKYQSQGKTIGSFHLTC